MDDDALLRYSRQIMLPEVDYAGQQRLAKARVAIVGLGGLGGPAAMYLAAAGIGFLTLADDDVVDLSNLQRQVIHATRDIGRRKTDSAAEHVAALNPDVTVEALSARMTPANLAALVEAADVVVDASDNFDTRFAINAACVAARTPLVTGAASGFSGQLIAFDFRSEHSACYHCLFGSDGDEAQNCTATGVIAPLVGIIGSLQAQAVINLLLNIGTDDCGRLLRLDGARLAWREARVARDPACPTCGPR